MKNRACPRWACCCFSSALDEENLPCGTNRSRTKVGALIWAREPLQPADGAARRFALDRWRRLTQAVYFEAAWVLPEEYLEGDWIDFDWDEWDEGEQKQNLDRDISGRSRRIECSVLSVRAARLAVNRSPPTPCARNASGLALLTMNRLRPDDWELLLQLDTGAGHFFDDM